MDGIAAGTERLSSQTISDRISRIPAGRRMVEYPNGRAGTFVGYDEPGKPSGTDTGAKADSQLAAGPGGVPAGKSPEEAERPGDYGSLRQSLLGYDIPR